MTDHSKSVTSREETLIWQHQAMGLLGDYAVDPRVHAENANECPLCLRDRVKP